jgi:hypothetical protein
MFRHTLCAALSGAALSIAYAPAACAAIATATLDWSQFVLSVLDIPGQPPPEWSFLQQAGSASSSALTLGDSSDYHMHTTFNWISPTTVDSMTPHGHATGRASGSTLTALAESTASDASASSWYANNNAAAQASRTATLSLQAPAAVVVTVPYALQAIGPAFDFDDYATARVSANANFQPAVGYYYSSVSRSYEVDSRLWFGPPEQQGTLIFGLVTDGPGTMTFSLDVSAQSFSRDAIPAVPEPSTALQLVAGMAMLGAIALRRGRRWHDGASPIAPQRRHLASVPA